MKIILIGYFLETAIKYPTKTAVVEGEQKITFSELKKRAVSISYAIVESISTINQPIAIFLPKEINTVIADMVITYGGNII